jgi:hypothetical protein
MIDFADLDTAAFASFAVAGCVYTPPAGGAPVTVRAILTGGDRVAAQLGGAGFRGPGLAADLLVAEVAADPSPQQRIAGAALRARLMVPAGAFAGTYTVVDAVRGPTGGTWSCSLERS